jgi:hypothetical protein
VQARSVEEAVNGEKFVFRPVDKLEIDGKELLTWDEATEREVEQDGIAIDQLLSSEREFSVFVPPGREIESLNGSDGRINGRIVRERWAIRGMIRLTAERMGRVIKIRIGIENLSEGPKQSPADRMLALRQSFLATHTLLSVSDGAFISLIDPPEWARDAAASCVNLRAWPVLAGEKGRRDIVLFAPIILYDYPQVAPESPGDLFDLTEIDELLTLRTMTLTEDEKREVRETDSRAAALLDRVDRLPQAMFSGLHGSVRYLRDATDHKHEPEPIQWWNPDQDGALSPETDQVIVQGVAVAKGSRVVLKPGCRPADAQDMFLRGRSAIVEAVFSDLEGQKYLAVTLLEDPGADLERSQKRFLYFYPEEVEPVGVTPTEGSFS